MHGPDGVDYPNKTWYHEVEKHKKLVYDHGGSDDRPPMFRVTVLFSSVDGKTTMDMTMTLPTAEEAEQTRNFVKQAGILYPDRNTRGYLIRASSMSVDTSALTST